MERCRVLIQEFPEAKYTKVFISGVLNLFKAREVRAELEPLLLQDRLRTVFDLDELESIDSSGIGTLVNFILAARKHSDAKVLFVRPRPMVSHIFEVTKLISFFTIVPDDEDIESFFAD